MATVGKIELASKIAESAEISKAKAGDILSALEKHVREALAAGDDVRVAGLNLSVEQTAERTGRNPATGEPIQIAAKNRLKCKASKDLKDALNPVVICS